MISWACPGCAKPLKVKGELAGKKVKCPGCARVTAVPDRIEALPSRSPPTPAREMPTGAPTGAAPPHEQPTVPPSAPPEATRTHHPAELGPDSSLITFLAPPQSDGELGRLGGFRIRKVLGHGGMGVVFQAEDPRLGRQVAIKAMLPHLADSRSAQERFLHEARAAAALEHDHIVSILQVGEDRGAPFIVMPLLRGEPLDERLRGGGALPVAEALRIGREVAGGLAAAHEKGLVHRDIKPANVWLEAPGGRVKVLDFGLARAAAGGARLTQPGAIVGTPAYMAPEQAQGQAVDARCDLFSLGCVLYRMCTGRLPFGGRDMVSTLVAVATEDPSPPRELRPEVPQPLSDLVMRLLAKKPEERPQSAREVAEALQEIEGQTAAPARPGRPTKRRARWPRLAAGVALSLGLVAALVLLWRTPRGAVRIDSSDGPRGSRVPAPPSPFPPLDLAWVQRVQALEPEEQVKEVAEELKRRNPGFDGRLDRSRFRLQAPKIRDGVVRAVGLYTDAVLDLSPLRALGGLEELGCMGGAYDKGRLTDLAPLRGLPLRTLFCQSNPGLQDLSPVSCATLENLTCFNTGVRDLAPLRPMPLEHFNCAGNPVADLSPLAGKPLRSLWISGAKVSDLGALRGMPLEVLVCDGVPFTDLSPLAEAPLRRLECKGTRVKDLSPLRGTPLESVTLDAVDAAGADVLRSIKTLKAINGKPAKEFWKEVDAQHPPKKP